MVPVMIEMLRFLGTWALVTETQDALTAITGHEGKQLLSRLV